MYYRRLEDDLNLEVKHLWIAIEMIQEAINTLKEEGRDDIDLTLPYWEGCEDFREENG
jgi:hypothetical protein